MHKGLPAWRALSLGIVNKVFDPYERRLIDDLIQTRIPKTLDKNTIFTE